MKRTGIVVFIFLLSFILGSVPQNSTGEVQTSQADQPEGIMTVKVSKGNVRKGPTGTSPVITKLRKGDKVKAISRKDKWYMIRLQGNQVGWAHKSLFFNTHKAEVANTAISGQIKEIRFKITPEGGETVMFRLNGYYPPKTFALDGGRPRLICDFFDTNLAAGIGRLLKTNGEIIQQIRISVYKSPKSKVRVVFDLVSGEDSDYEIQPMFFKDENTYALTINRVPKE